MVITLVLLTVQGWTGDTNNLFVTTSSVAASSSFSGVLNTIVAEGPFLVWHASEGTLPFVLSLAVLALSMWSKPKSVRTCAILGTLMVLSASVGGLLFVLSGFQSAAGSAQTGGSFIGAYAFFFMGLYYAK